MSDTDNRGIGYWLYTWWKQWGSTLRSNNGTDAQRTEVVSPVSGSGAVRVSIVEDSTANPTTAQIGTVRVYDEVTGVGRGFNFYAGQPVITSQDYLYAMVEGDVPGHTPFRKLCRSNAITTTEVPVWAPATAYVFPSIAGQQMELYCASPNDTAAGSGIRSVKLTYLDTSYTERTEIIATAGNTPVPTVATNIVRVNRLRAVTGATTQTVAAGNIDIRALADTPIYSRIAAGMTRACTGVFTVPAGKRLFITSMLCSGGTGTGARFVVFNLKTTWDEVLNEATSIFLPNAEVAVEDGGLLRTFETPITLGPQTDVLVTALSDGASTICRVGLRGWLE
jgi:hypothetical protein